MSLTFRIQVTKVEMIYSYTIGTKIKTQEGMEGIPLTGLAPPHFCACTKPGPDAICSGLFLCSMS
jgi:hypothetical protein